jgi:hypothetical protein
LKVAEYSAKGGEVCQSIIKQPKPAGMSDDDFKNKVETEKFSAQNNCEYLETSGYNAITSETDPKNRMAEIELFAPAYPDSKFGDAVSNYALYTLGPGQLNDPTRLVSFGEKILAKNPNSLPALLLLANHYSEANSSTKAITYAQKAVDVANADAPDADKTRKLSAGAGENSRPASVDVARLVDESERRKGEREIVFYPVISAGSPDLPRVVPLSMPDCGRAPNLHWPPPLSTAA